MKTIIGLVRHGMTDWNRQGKIQGHTDIPLNEEGREQARRLGMSLKDEEWDVIGSSDLQRARETAEIIGRAIGRKVDFTDVRLRERSYGVLEGATFEERTKYFQAIGAAIPEGGETDEEVVARAEQLLMEIARTYDGKRVLLVTHGGWIVRVLKFLFPEVEFGYIGNTSISIIAWDNGRWKPLALNRQAHLDEDANE